MGLLEDGGSGAYAHHTCAVLISFALLLNHKTSFSILSACFLPCKIHTVFTKLKSEY